MKTADRETPNSSDRLCNVRYPSRILTNSLEHFRWFGLDRGNPLGSNDSAWQSIKN
jgi:hypothetical protein